MPNFSNSSTPDYSSRANITGAGADREFSSEYFAGLKREEGYFTSPLKSTAATAVDLVDTVSSSLGITDRQQINNNFLSAVGSPGFTAWFEQNREAVEVGSGVGGIVLSFWAANRLLAPAGKAMQAIRGVPYAGKIATLDRQYQRAVQLATLTRAEGSRRALAGAELYSSSLPVLKGLGRAPLTPRAAAANVRRAAIQKGAAFNLATEGIMAATLNQNGFLFTDELSHNLTAAAAGVVLGAGIDNMIANYTLRKISNSEQIRVLNAAALDRTGLEINRTSDASALVDLLPNVTPQGSFEAGFLFESGDAISAEITSLAISAKANQKQVGFTARAKALFGKAEPLGVQQETQAKERLGLLTKFGVPAVGNTGFTGGAALPTRQLFQSLDRDPTFVYGVRGVGLVPEGQTVTSIAERSKGNLTSVLAAKQKLLKEGGKYKIKKRPDGKRERVLVPLKPKQKALLQQEIADLRQRASDSYYTMLEIGEWTPVEYAEKFSGFAARPLLQEGDLGEGGIKIWTRDMGTKEKPNRIGVGSNGQLYLGSNKRIEQLSNEEMINLFHTGADAIQEMKQQGAEMLVQEKAHWFVLDMAESLDRAAPDARLVSYSGKLTKEAAKVESFAQKVDSIRKKIQALQKAKVPITAEALYELKVTHNLPRITPHETALLMTHEDPIDVLLFGFKSGAEVRKLSYAELERILQSAKQVKGLTDDTLSSFDKVSGNSFAFMRDYNGEMIQPMVAARKEFAPDRWSRDQLLVQQGLTQATIMTRLMGQTADSLNRELTALLSQSPSYAEARKVLELADDQSRSFLPGLQNTAPQHEANRLFNKIVPTTRRDVDDPVRQAATTIREMATKITNAQIRDTIEKNMGDLITVINSPRNVTSKFLLDQFATSRPGWELLREPALTKDSRGKVYYKFMLDHESAVNKNRFEAMFGKPLTKGQALLTAEGKEVILDDLGMQYRRGMQKVHKTRLDAKNTLLRARGMRQILEVPWFVESASDKGKFVAYQFDGQNNLVPGRKISANSPEELAEEINRIESDPAFPQGHKIRQRDYVENFLDLFERAQLEFMAPNVTAIQPGKKNLGLSTTATHNPNALKEELISTRANMARHSNDLLELLFHDPLLAARSRAAISEPRRKTGGADEVTDSVFSQWEKNLLGYSKKDTPSAIVSSVNKLLRESRWSKPQVMDVASDYIRGRFKVASQDEKLFTRLTEELGPHMPFKTAQEMVEKRLNEKLPPELERISKQISWFESGYILRWFESMMAVTNIGGILANTPAVMKALGQQGTETIAETAARNSSLGMRSARNHVNIGFLDSQRLMYQGMKNAWKTPDHLQAVVAKAERLGYMDQEVAELDRAWNSIESKDGLYGFFLGNPAADFGTKTGLGIRNKIAQTGGVDKWIGILTDKSEAFSRRWAMHIGLEAGWQAGMRDADELLQFAHEISNKVIADYNPLTRPDIYRGPIGATIGLFQTYGMNFYSRMFRYIESGSKGALASQYAMQSMVFGLNSTPGWATINDFFFANRRDEEDPLQTFERTFGEAESDVLLYGTLANLPKLFGGQASSVYTRGDATPRIPINPIASVGDLLGLTDTGAGAQFPLLDTAKRVAVGVYEGVAAFASEQGLSSQRAAEIASNVIANRPISGFIESVGAGGYDTDFHGQVVSEAKTLAEHAYRWMGIRSMQQQKQIAAFYSDKKYQEGQTSKQATLRKSTRAAIRSGNLDTLAGTFKNYVLNGGDPAYYTRWVKETMESATDTRTERALREALKNPNNDDVVTIGRLLDSGIDIEEEEANDDDYGRQEQLDQLLEQKLEESPDPLSPF